VTRPAVALTCAALTCAALLAGCGAGAPIGARIRGDTLRVYLSVPFRGASSSQGRAISRGARIALADQGGRIGRYRVSLVVLDDSTIASDGWDPSQTTLNVKMAVRDPETIGYVGDLSSGATAISLPPLNRAGIAQVSPAAGAVGLTSSAPGASPGEPGKYYPTGIRSFARVIPSDAVEAAAVVRVQHTLGCRAAFVLQDGEVDGEDAAISYALAAQAAGMRVLGVESFQRQAADYSPLAASVAQAGADCVLIDATDERSSALLAVQLARAMPRVRIFASSLLADSAFVSPAEGGIPLSLDSRMVVFAPALDPSAYPRSGRDFLSRYARLYGPPEPQAIFGYAAMSLMLRAIATGTDGGRKPAGRAKVVDALLATRDWRSVLGRLTLDGNGDPSTRAYGVYKVAGGRLSYWFQIG
jgi:branched-chain amino acid transport system substrate-binding protein